jgi:hypothetical protein
VSRVSLRTAFLAVAIAGFVLMIGFDATVTRILGVGCILGALALGVAAIATPEFLEADAGENGEVDGESAGATPPG